MSETRECDLVVFGTAAQDRDGNLGLTDIGRGRGECAVEAYGGHPRRILITGGRSKDLKNILSPVTEADLLYGLMTTEHHVPSDVFLLEKRSRETIDSILRSVIEFPDLFEGVLRGENRIGFVSDEYHLDRTVEAFCELFDCPERQVVRVSTGRRYNQLGEAAARKIMLEKVAKIKEEAVRYGLGHSALLSAYLAISNNFSNFGEEQAFIETPRLAV